MPETARKNRTTVPVRSLFSDAPARPGVYRSISMLADRWVFYALGLECELLGLKRPAAYQTDDEVIAALEDMMRTEPRPTALQLVNDDTISAAGLDPVFHRPFSMPRRLALVPPEPRPVPR